MVARKRAPKLHIPADRRERNPLITQEGYRLLKSVLEHPAAPRWNYVVGDRVVADDLKAVDGLRKRMRGAGKRPRRTDAPSESVIEWVEAMRPRVWAFQDRLAGIDPASQWEAITPMTREDLAARIEEVVPVDADLERMIVYDTSGTTGHAIHVPHHPRAMAMNHAFMEYVLRRHGVKATFGSGRVACINIGAQRDTVVFATVFSVWKQAGFAKVNLHPGVWDEERARRFFAQLRPQIVTGDPVAFAEMLRWDVDVAPAALISTAAALTSAWRERLSERYRCPVIDSYATTETGPIAYSDPDAEGMRVLPPDVYVEIVDGAGLAVREGELGEICVTGGRNPFVPLLRYRTGDFARLVWDARKAAPRLVDLQARQMVLYRAADGSPLNPVDVGRVIRKWPIVQHTFTQRADYSCELVMRCAPGLPVDERSVRDALARVFGPVPDVVVRSDESLGEGDKVIPFASEIECAPEQG
jgi:phenylacetate-CoA ligase